MKIATVLYTYNRSMHTENVLKALKNNRRLPEILYIFQDGLKTEAHREEWEKTNKIINAIDWCKCKIIAAECNKGLATSIVSGLNYVFQEFDAAIVLEDDCVAHPLFMDYMYDGLNYYADEEKVYSVCGYSYPVEVKQNGTDVYFTKRASSWGWGTWKNRWEIYEEDYRILGRIKKNPYLSKQLQFWGEDLESYLLGNVYGNCNSWAVFWALNILEHDGYCVYPYKSLINNIGFDGSGVHCGKQKLDEIKMQEIDLDKKFLFSNDLFIDEKTEHNYSNYWAWKSVDAKNSCYYNILLRWMEMHKEGRTINEFLEANGISKLCIWGKGKVCDLLIGEIKDSINILAIIESKPIDENYKGINIVNIDNIPSETEAIIIIPEYDYEKILWKLEEKYCGRVLKLSEIIR